MKQYSQKEENERKHFNSLAKKYDDNYGYKDTFTKYKIAKKTSFLANLIKEYQFDKDSKILELGCGTGVYTRELAKAIPKSKIDAIDISETIIGVAKKESRNYKNIKYHTASVYSTGLKDNSVDVVFGFYVLHHLDVKKISKEIRRILKPGGLVFFYEPNILNPWVFLVKSVPWLKKKAGDTVDEWAVNPLRTEKDWNGFNVLDNSTTEFVLPINSLSHNFKVLVDKFTNSTLQKMPLVCLLGGSLRMVLKKETGDDLELKYKTERSFHDGWADSIKFKDVNYIGAFEAETAIENRFALSQLGDLKGKRILDLGCGMGDASMYFALKGALVSSIDISPHMILLVNRIAKKNKVGNKIKASVMVAEDLKFKSGYFDYVFGNGVLHHVVPKLALREVYRVLKKGGTAAFIEPLEHNPVINIYRSIADKVRTPTEVPLKYENLDNLTDAKFSKKFHKEFHLFTLFIFLWFYVVEGVNPNRERYWKKIINDAKKIRLQFNFLNNLDGIVLGLASFFRRYCWNTVLVFKK